MDGTPQPPKKRETPSDRLRHATVNEFLQAHGRPTNGGVKGFFQSNLFSALVIWVLSQAVIIAGIVITFYVRTSQLSEWKGKLDATLERMDKDGTFHGHYADERQDKQLAQHETRLEKLEDVTKHSEVNEFEVRQLRKEVEDSKSGKK